MAITKIRQSQVNGLVEELNKIKEQIKTYREPVALLSDLPIENNNEGDVRVCLEDKNIYVWSDGQWHINTVKGSFAKTIFLTIESDNQTIINTGIRYDEQGDLRTNSNVINLYLNGVLVDKVNYTIENIDEEMIINWNSIEVPLELDDLIAIQFYDITGGLKLNLGGSSSGGNNIPVENSDVIIVGKAILPKVTKTVDIGSEDLRFRSIYVDEAYLDANTLYIDGVPVLGTQADNIVVKADPDQSITVKTSGVGSTKVTSESNLELSTNNLGANVDIKAQGNTSKVNISSAESVNISGQTVNVHGETTLGNTYTGNLTVRGKLTMQGQVTEIQSENMTIKDNMIELNKGEIGNGVSAGSAGIKIDRGDELPYLFVFDETDDMFKIGEKSDLETIATREWVADNFNNIGGSNSGSDGSNNDSNTEDKNIINNHYITINELSNPLTTTPLEYGYFSLAENQTTNLSVGDIVKFSKVMDGNMTIDEGKVFLKGGKTYNISMHMVTKAERCDIRFKNETTNEFIGKGNICISAASTYAFSPACSVDFLYTPECDSIIYPEIIVSTSTEIIYNLYTNLVIQEIRNNPVNQYGGFETEVLFDGNANSVGEYTLSDDLTKYDFLYVEGNITHTNGIMNPVFSIIDTNNCITNVNNSDRNYSLILNRPNGSAMSWNVCIFYNFKSATTLRIAGLSSYGSTVNDFGIIKITGIKGQIPSLLVGGEF